MNWMRWSRTRFRFTMWIIVGWATTRTLTAALAAMSTTSRIVTSTTITFMTTSTFLFTSTFTSTFATIMRSTYNIWIIRFIFIGIINVIFIVIFFIWGEWGGSITMTTTISWTRSRASALTFVWRGVTFRRSWFTFFWFSYVGIIRSVIWIIFEIIIGIWFWWLILTVTFSWFFNIMIYNIYIINK